MQQLFKHSRPLQLESGTIIQEFHLVYTTHGQLSKAKDNVVWVFHALTANSDPAEWWPGLIGEGKLFDPASYFIICVNMPGSFYGSIGPLDTNPLTNRPYFHEFPLFTTRDMIRCYSLLKEELGIDRIYIGIGGSMGGQQLLEWAIEDPNLFEHIIPIAANAVHSPWAIAFNTSQRLAIEGDTSWKDKTPEAGIHGMKTARSIALLSYRNYYTYQIAQSEETSDKINGLGGDASTVPASSDDRWLYNDGQETPTKDFFVSLIDRCCKRMSIFMMVLLLLLLLIAILILLK